MERGLYIAATGMLSSMTRQDAIASNLANVNTVGYKADRVVNETFSSLFLNNMQAGGGVGAINFGTRIAGVVTDFSQGAMRATGNQMDVALVGDGFFAIQTSQGVQYTRAGEFARIAEGYLTTQRGDYVLGTDRKPIYVGDEGTPGFAADGHVVNGKGETVGQIEIVTLDEATMKKVGENMWTGTETGTATGSTAVRQGFVEASTVNSVKEMVEMISTLRTYESAQRAVLAIDGTLDRAVNSVGQVG